MKKQFLSICYFILTSFVFSLGNTHSDTLLTHTTEICRAIRTRILNEGDTFEPQRCYLCQCLNSTLSCKDQDPAECPEPPCDSEVQISTPDRCCKICPGIGSRCRFNGMTVEDGESFQLAPRGSCSCHNTKLTCVGEPLNRQ